MARVGSGGEGSLYEILLEDLQKHLPLEHGCVIGCRCNVGFQFLLYKKIGEMHLYCRRIQINVYMIAILA